MVNISLPIGHDNVVNVYVGKFYIFERLVAGILVDDVISGLRERFSTFSIAFELTSICIEIG